MCVWESSVFSPLFTVCYNSFFWYLWKGTKTKMVWHHKGTSSRYVFCESEQARENIGLLSFWILLELLDYLHDRSHAAEVMCVKCTQLAAGVNVWCWSNSQNTNPTNADSRQHFAFFSASAGMTDGVTWTLIRICLLCEQHKSPFQRGGKLCNSKNVTFQLWESGKGNNGWSRRLRIDKS